MFYVPEQPYFGLCAVIPSLLPSIDSMENNMFRRINMYLGTIGLCGILSAIMAKVTKTTVYFRLKRHDCKHPFCLRIPTSDIPTYRQVFINHEYRFNAENPPHVIVDAGANIGLAAIYFANKYPDARIIAIEPEISNYELLKHNVAPYTNITPVQSALWHKNEEVNLIDPGFGKWAFMTEENTAKTNISRHVCHAVMGMTVDKIIRDYNLERIDVLKIDIEGAEKEVFSDTSAWIECVDSIIIELHERMKPGCNRSFYCGSNGFDNEWLQGENVYLSRGSYLTRCSY